jgi:hypothetical protein
MSKEGCALQIPEQGRLIIIKPMTLLWRTNLLLAINRSLLNREHTQGNLLKTLVSAISRYNRYVSLLPKITPRYFTEVTRLNSEGLRL